MRVGMLVTALAIGITTFAAGPSAPMAAQVKGKTGAMPRKGKAHPVGGLTRTRVIRVKKLVRVRHADGHALSRALRWIRTRRGRVRYIRDLGVMLLVDELPVVQQMERVLARLDTPQKQVSIRLYLVLAGRKSKKGSVTPEALKPVVKQLGRLFRYKTYRLLDSAFVRSTNNRHALVSLGGERRYQAKITPRFIPGPKGGRVRMEFRLYKPMILTSKATGPRTIRRHLVSSVTTVPNGTTVVIGASRLNGGDEALITVVKVKAW